MIFAVAAAVLASVAFAQTVPAISEACLKDLTVLTDALQKCNIVATSSSTAAQLQTEALKCICVPSTVTVFTQLANDCASAGAAADAFKSFNAQCATVQQKSDASSKSVAVAAAAAIALFTL
ncbi:UNVERIFIED_CONTAM: hypothetical protein HDU68_007945 [Siphonaria sp. JEL0065]|nr:hypothetical protein HDU68_007945 [Siphonaria sp. JEL0065]